MRVKFTQYWNVLLLSWCTPAGIVTSRKIRAVNKAKGEQGERLTTNIPYGYKANPDNPKGCAVDEEAAKVVKRIFALCMEGQGPSQITALLEKEKVLNPTAYKQREGRKTPHQTPENEYRWHESTVAYILEYMEYTGCTVNFKTYTNSIWDKKQRDNPMDNRKIFYNTHPAIISLEVFIIMLYILYSPISRKAQRNRR